MSGPVHSLFHDTDRGAGRIRGDVVAGLVVALLSLPMTIPLGVLALSPLGPDYVGAGVVAGFQSSIFAGFISALSGGSPFQISGPRASISLIMASALASALADPAIAGFGLRPEDAALTIGFVVVFCAGLLQVGLGLIRIGDGIRFVPYPVLSGFMNGVAILIVLGQLPAALGLPTAMHWYDVFADVRLISPLCVAVTLVTMLVMGLAPRITRAVPPIVLALAFGVIIDQALRQAFGPAVGPLVAHIDAGLPWPVAIAGTLDLARHKELLVPLLIHQLPIIFVLTLVGSMESLLSATALDIVTGTRHDSNRELIGQGLGNMVAACFGGVASTGHPCAASPAIEPAGAAAGPAPCIRCFWR